MNYTQSIRMAALVALIAFGSVYCHSPQDTIVMFDIDGVILKFDKWAIAKEVRGNFGTIARNLVNFKLHKKLRRLGKRGATAREYIAEIKRSSQPKLARFVRKIVQCKQPYPAMQALARQLRKQGLELHIASNMDIKHYRRFKRKYPVFEECFTKEKLVDFDRSDACKKPKDEYFEQYLRECKPAEGKTLVFIDDKQANGTTFLRVMKRRNRKAVFLHHNPHKPEETRKKLIDMGILSKATPARVKAA